MIKKLIQAAALLAVCSGAAHASTFDFSYTFTDGQKLTGSLDGTLSGNLITDVSNISVTFDNNTFSGSLVAGTFVPPPAGSTAGSYDYSANAAVISTDAALNNFIISDTKDPNTTTNWFYFVNGTTPDLTGTQEVLAANANTGDVDFDNPAAGQWSVQPVPVPAALPLMLSGLGFFAAARRRRQNAAA